MFPDTSSLSEDAIGKPNSCNEVEQGRAALPVPGRTTLKEDGFASAQFIGLMALSIALIATFVNVLIIEYMRSSSYAAVRQAARAGTQVVDLGKAVENGEGDRATEVCKENLKESADDLFSADESDLVISCEIIEDDSVSPTRFSMKATVTVESGAVYVVPWAVASKSRLKNISATYEQRQSANPGSIEDEDVVDPCEEDIDACPDEDGAP